MHISLDLSVLIDNSEENPFVSYSEKVIPIMDISHIISISLDLESSFLYQLSFFDIAFLQATSKLRFLKEVEFLERKENSW